MTSITIQSNNIENIVLGKLAAKWSARGDRILRYYLDVRHTKLNLHRELSAPEIFILQSKADALIASWDEKFADYKTRLQLSSGKQAADDLTASAIANLASLEHILAHTLNVNDEIDWEALKDRSEYQTPTKFDPPRPRFSPTDAPTYTEPKISLWSQLTGKKPQLLEDAKRRHAETVSMWEGAEKERQAAFERALASWEADKADFWAEHAAAKQEFETQQAEANAKVDALKDAVRSGDPEAVVEHASLVLEASDYGGLFEKDFEAQYDPEGRVLMIGYQLPAPSQIPKVRAVKFVKVTGELTETRVSDREQKQNFETVGYQVCLRTIHEVFEADVDRNFDKVLFNGYVTAVDPRSGQEVRSCLMSILVDRSTFETIDLSRVEPKACFKSLKGVSAASLASLSAIPPVMEMNREDRRFVDSRAVGEGFDEETNLATISWEDFEHLVREVFEQEFSSRGGEVRVTQASRDGGVDAIAFDPDPISGGKIVIQAKRYTRTVGVSAVRDLYGTVLNEGASKGILVTTADYGPDAYQFANGKPITLMSGSNLLHLMQKHGHRARIDVKAAREAMGKT
jgi:restriction system protein